MFYYLGQLMDQASIPGAGMFRYISFRAALAFIASLVIAAGFGKRLIGALQRRQIGETIRDLGLEGQMQKRGTPTMGGLIIIAATLLPTLLFAQLHNVYVLLMLVTTLLMGAIGFLDDYIKVFRKNKKGLAGKFKVMGQVATGLIVGLTMWLHPDIVIRENAPQPAQAAQAAAEWQAPSPGADARQAADAASLDNASRRGRDVKATRTNIPFFKNNSGDYRALLFFMDAPAAARWAWVVFVLVVVLVVTAVSNGANMTDGLDGLATGSSAIIGVTLGVLAYLSGNVIYASYLDIFYIPQIGELVIFMAAFIGALVGFLWYNAFPAQVFMGDTGSLTIGGIIAVYAILIRKELLIPVLCGIFLVENLSVILQVSWFKWTRRRHGEGRRIFRMAPLHHHYQMKEVPEPKIVIRFWIVGVMLAVVTILTLKIR